MAGRDGLGEPLLRRPPSNACVLAAGGGEAASRALQRRLLAALVIAGVFMGVELVGGWFAGSLAVMSDAAHLFADAAGFLVAFLAARWASAAAASAGAPGEPSAGGAYSYGYHRVEVLGALASVMSVWLVTGVLVYEAVARLRHPQDVDGRMMLGLAALGVAVNVLLLWVLGGHHHHHGGGGSGAHAHAHEELGNAEAATHRDSSSRAGSHHHHRKNLNMRGAVAHAAGDLVQSLGVVVAGALIWARPQWTAADPACTFLFAAAVLWTTRGVLADVGDVLMERVPRGICVAALEAELLAVPGVTAVHDLHVWSLTPAVPLLAAHLEVAPGADARAALEAATAACRRAGVTHTTIQLQAAGAACPACGPCP